MKNTFMFLFLVAMSMISVTVLVITYIIHKLLSSINSALNWVMKKIL